MSMDNNTNGVNGTSTTSLLQKFLNGDIDLRSIEQKDLRVRITIFLKIESDIFSIDKIF